MKELLVEILNLINMIEDLQCYEEVTIGNIKLRIDKLYRLQKHQIGTNEVLRYFRKEFGEDIKLYILLLSIIFECCHDESILIEVYDVLLLNDLDVFDELLIRYQNEAKAFAYNIEKLQVEIYIRKRLLNKKMLAKLSNLVDINRIYLPLAKRNVNRIVIVTNQLLGDLHAPTRVVKEICNCLQKELGMEVLLIIASEEYNYEQVQQLWINPIILNYGEKKEGYISIDCFGEKVKGIKLKINRENINNLKRWLRVVYNFNPLCVWYMGGLTLFADLLIKYTTVLAMPFTKNFSDSEAQILVRYLKGEKKVSREIENYIQGVGQKVIDMKIPYKPNINKRYLLEDFGIPSHAYPILIVGNRLDKDITEDFIDMLRKIIQIDSRVYIVFIGIFEKFYHMIDDKIFKNRMTYLGYRKDLADIMSIGKIFLNPPRQGGGAGGICAIFQGIPVITLPDNDVAIAVGEEFICKNEKDMIKLVERYIKDEVFYANQSMIARRKAIEENDISLEEEIRKLIQRVKEEILNEKGEE